LEKSIPFLFLVKIKLAMKNTHLLFNSISVKISSTILSVFLVSQVFAQTLGNYSNSSISNSGGNLIVSPSGAPSGTTRATATSSPDFKGKLEVDPTTGDVTILNAHPAGVYTIKVNAYGSGYTNKTFNLTVNANACSYSNFSSVATVGAQTTPRSIAVADFNGDGNQDVAISNQGSNSVSIRLGDGSGGFSGSTNVSVATTPRSVATADFNGDGNIDIATANSGSSNVSIRLGDGSGGFSGSTNVSVSSGPYSIAIGDFNGDGNADFATANNTGGTVSIRLGNGSGGFSGSTNISMGANPWSVAVGDFNNDGKDDFATANNAGNSVSIRLGNGSGGFSGTTSISVGTDPRFVAIADVDGDGNQDIATANAGGNSVSILLGDGIGGFGSSSSVSVGSAPRSVAFGDFNGDGNIDLVASNITSNNVSIRLGDGSGGFSGSNNPSVGSNPFSVIVADFNQDGVHDLAVANSVDGNMTPLMGINPEINVKGNGNDIADGDNSTDLSDDTDFGITTANVSITKTFTIENLGPEQLNLSGSPLVQVGGANPSEFSVTVTPSSSIAGLSSTTFAVTFLSSNVGNYSAIISIANNDCDESSYDFSVSCEVICGAGIPVGTNNYSGNVTLTAQTQVDAFFNSVAGPNYGNKYTKITGNLTIDGGNYSDPITSICNLWSLNEVTGSVIIKNFIRNGNPSNLDHLSAFTTLGCNLSIYNNPKFLNIELASLSTIGCALNIYDNAYATSINLPALTSLKGDQLNIKNNPKAEWISLSSSAGSFNFTGSGSSIDVSVNGATAANPLSIDLNKITVVKGPLVFNNNDNSGVSNFDAIFGGLTNVSGSWGNLTITNNDYLGKCCIAASAVVAGSRTISGNTGDCANTAAVIADCGPLNKKSSAKYAANDEVVLSTFPNPNNGNFSVQINSSKVGVATVSITDIMGREVFKETRNLSGNLTVPVKIEFFSEGQYIVKAEINGQLHVSRVRLTK
jgi:hypothetical protein